MELRHLRYFAEVARSGTYHGAAERVRVAQPALWQQVQVLQRELGVQLFERDGRRVRLTRAGGILLECAEKVMTAAERLEETAANLRAGRRGVLSIACYTPHLERFLARVIGRFEKAYPDIHIELLEFSGAGGEVGSQPRSFAELQAGNVDLATGPGIPPGGDGFMVDQSAVVALVGAEHRWARRSRIHIDDLRAEPLLLHAGRESFSRSAVERACHIAGFEPHVKLESVSAIALARLAENGVGVALVPDAVVPPDYVGTTLIVRGAGDLLHREVWLCWLRSGARSAAARAFIDEARAHVPGS
jgi:DNA-binding transcriptional LysR family regulator